MYSINGIALDNPSLGWELLAPSEPLSSLEMRSASVEETGRDGVASYPATRGPVTLKFVVRTPYANLSTLLALFSEPGLEVRELADPTRVAHGGLRSSSPGQHFPRVDLYSHQFLVRIPEGCWRGGEATTALTSASALGATLTTFTGLSAPVQDAQVRFKGPITDPQVTDLSGAFIAVDGTIPSGEFVRFDSSTGRAWQTGADTWQGGDEVSGQVTAGGPRTLFEITPRLDPADPRSREARLTLTQADYSAGSGVQVRGRPAFLL